MRCVERQGSQPGKKKKKRKHDAVEQAWANYGMERPVHQFSHQT